MKTFNKKIILSLSALVFIFSTQTMIAFAQYDYGYAGSSAYTTPTYNYNTTSYNYGYAGSSAYTTPTYNYGYAGSSAYTTPTYNYGYAGSSAYTTPTYNYTSPTNTYTTPTSAYTTPTYTTPTNNYVTPTYTSPSYNYTYPTNSYITPTYTYTNPSNSYINISYQTQYQTCWNGTVIPTTSTCPTQYQTCPNGSVILTTQTCPVTPTTQTCWNGTVIPINSTCPAQTQTCWNGSVIPVNQACPSQYQTCPNGTQILIGQSCPSTTVYNYTNPTYYPTPPVITYPTTIYPTTIYPVITTPALPVTINNVVTGPATQISDITAKCNGIGLIANSLSSIAWFEYGTTPSLGNVTQSVNIGTYHTSPFSNILINLRPNTIYYCRANMSNALGSIKGEVVSFRTKATAVIFAEPVYVPVSTPVKKEEVICDVNVNQKALTLSLEKTSGDINVNGEVKYNLAYKNISSTTKLSDVTVKIIVPTEFVITSMNMGSYDYQTKTITFKQGILNSEEGGNITFTAKVSGDSQVGKTIVVNGYTSYTFYDVNRKAVVQDEVSAYLTDTIMSDVKDIKTETNTSFLPQSLIEWFALLAIIFILMVLGRSIYKTYKEDSKSKK